MAGNNDILMMLCQSGTTPMAAESQAILGTNDILLNLSPRFQNGGFFELDSFTMTVAAESSDPDAGKNAPPPKTSSSGSTTDATPPSRKIGRNTTWNPGMLSPITCVRQVDHSSPLLFQECGKATKFASAAIVRRKVVGGGLGSQNQDNFLMSYLRADFLDVVFIEVAWNSGEDGIKETLQFVCSKATVQYRQQVHTGSITSKNFPPGIWQK